MRAFQLDGVSRGMSLLVWTSGQPIQVPTVSHQMINFAEYRGDLWGGPAVRSGPEPDHKELCSTATISWDGVW